MEKLCGIPKGTINSIFGKSITPKDYLVRFTPKNHPSVKLLDMKDSDYLVEVPLFEKVDENSISAVYEMIDKIKLITEISPKIELENINGVNYPVTYCSDGIVIVYYPDII